MSTRSESSSTLDQGASHEPEKVETPSEPHESLQRKRTVEEHALSDALRDPTNLPYQTLSENADMSEFTEETANGLKLHEVQSNKTGKTERYELVTFKEGDPENPKNWSKAFKWYCTMTVAFTCFVVAFNSGIITADLKGPEKTFGVSEEVSLLVITMFVVGFGVGPMAFGSSSCSIIRLYTLAAF